MVGLDGQHPRIQALTGELGEIPLVLRGLMVNYTSLKLTFSHLKMDGWNTIVSIWDDLFSEVMLVLGRVVGLFLGIC